MPFRALASTVLLTALPTLASADWQGLPYGITIDELRALVPSARRNDDRGQDTGSGNTTPRARLTAGYQINGVPVDAFFQITVRAVLMGRREMLLGRRLILPEQERERDEPGWFWRGFMGQDSSQGWTHGTFEGRGDDPRGPCVLKLTDVHLLAEILDLLLPATTRSSLVEPPKAKAGGQPALPWWDDLWCAVWGLIQQGNFKPETQAEVECAMLAWAWQNGHDASEAPVGPKACKLFVAHATEARTPSCPFPSDAKWPAPIGGFGCGLGAWRVWLPRQGWPAKRLWVTKPATGRRPAPKGDSRATSARAWWCGGSARA